MKPTVQQKEVIEIVEEIPDYLLVHPCEAVSARDPVTMKMTLGSVSKGYVTNTLCVGQYRNLVEQQKSYLERLSKDRKKNK